MDKPAITYAAHPDATSEAEISALANIYKFILDCRAKKEAAGPRQAGNLEDEKGSMHDSRRPQYTRT